MREHLKVDLRQEQEMTDVCGELKGKIPPKNDISIIIQSLYADERSGEVSHCTNISGTSQQNSIAAFSLTTKAAGGLFRCVKKMAPYKSSQLDFKKMLYVHM